MAGAALVALAACNGAGTTGGALDFPANGDSPPVGASYAQTDPATAQLALSGAEGDGTPVSDASAGTIVLPGDTITGGRLAGTLNGAGTEILLTGGGTVTLTDPGNTEYVRFFEASPRNAPAYSGVVGFRTDPAEVPTGGRAAYSGAASVDAFTNDSRYSLTGNAEVQADFAAARVSVDLTGLTGTRQSGADTFPANVDAIRVADGVLSGGIFSGGSPSVTGALFSLGASADASDSEGAFYGAQADEAAGRIIVRDPGGPDGVAIVGRYAAD